MTARSSLQRFLPLFLITSLTSFEAVFAAEEATERPQIAAASQGSAGEGERIEPSSGGQDETGADWTEEAILLYDREGRRLEAVILAADGNRVSLLRRIDGRRFVVPIETFSEGSRQEIVAWQEAQAEGADFSFNVEIQKRLVDSDVYETAGRELKTSDWVYDVSLVNLTRHELRDAELEYRIIRDDKVAFSRTAAGPGEGEMQDGETLALPAMSYNARAEFTTEPVTLETYRYRPTRGEPEFRRDRLVGLWIRLVRKGEVVQEFKSRDLGMEDRSWDGEEGTEIRVRDSFAEQFQRTDRLLAR